MIMLGDLFSNDELKRAGELFTSSPPGTFCTNVVREVITPDVLARINEKTEQQNDARYLGYALEHALTTLGRLK